MSIDIKPNKREVPPVLILSTGRCGSTMISEILNLHPKILSMSEFFVPLGPGAFARKKLSGEQMWKILSRQSPGLHAMLKDGIVVDEGLYPYDDPGSRFSAFNLPPIMTVTLPHLTDNYETLYNDLENYIKTLPAAELGEQYNTLFDFLMEKLARDVWVERSGGSLMHAAKLIKLFPEARIIHVYRDGRDTAISMSKHHNFKVLLGSINKCRKYGIDPSKAFLESYGKPADEWFQKFFFKLFDIKKIGLDNLRLRDYGKFWSDLICIADKVFKDIPANKILNIKFEDVQNKPQQKLEELIRFIDESLYDDDWLTKASAMLRPTRSKFTELPAEEQSVLTKACEPGLKLLGYAI
jgi:hypothetical protein